MRTTSINERPEPLIGASVAIRTVQEESEYAAQSDAKVLLTGESGVGKEVVARGPEDADIKMEALQFGVLCVLTRVVTRDFLPTIAKVIERRGSPVWH